jgi:hypothetical protein
MGTQEEGTEIVVMTGDIEMLEAQQRAEYDISITTAKKFPRNLTRIKENCIALVTMDKEIAESCRYSLPRGGKNLSGPSVHMARILAQQYGNIRVEARIKQVTDKQVVSEAVCFDLETNYACKIEVRRSIVGKNGRFNDDMITVTGNASNAIAYRNAVLAVIPKGIQDIVYKAVMEMIIGDVSDENKLTKARVKALEVFKEEYKVSEKQLLKAMGLNSIGMIKAEQIADLRGMIQSLKDGDSTVVEMFPEEAPKIDPVKTEKTNAKKADVPQTTEVKTEIETPKTEPGKLAI